ncbi:hypothetical protein CWE15_05895 [Aliidiomarina taiwanensis]|uniref:Peroxidase n=1 Tax=Aliidiomarina taiwanensis TaxID=946228 RepID=A0A432X7S8_9GAMM|nr:Dyp-type peroxidase [Aliidiomarina taiwanensis]RUO42931.1 hypothetical protein CWE15_05895 [Aliidiomarina taiwanensis]
MHKPQEGICAEPSIHSWVLLLDVTSDDVDGVRQQLKRFPKFADELAARFSEAQLSCVLAIGEGYWDILSSTRPRELAPQPVFMTSEYPLPSSHADLALIFRADRMDATYFAGRVMLEWLQEFVVLNEEIDGFRYLDGRDLFGFKIEPNMPHGQQRRDFAYIPESVSREFAGGSYLWFQRNFLDVNRWHALDVEQQRELMGREKVSGEPWPSAQPSHRDKTSRVLADGKELALWRLQMPVASMQTSGEMVMHWSRSQKDIEAFMAQRYCGEADPLLDYQTAERNDIMFAPSRTWLADL